MTTPTEAPIKGHGIFRRLYYGETDFNIISRAKVWFAISGTLILIGLVALGVRGLNLGIDFTGGNQWEVAANGVAIDEAEGVIEDLGFSEVRVQEVGQDLRIRTAALEGTADERQARNLEVVEALSDLTGVDPVDMVIAEVGPSWGEEISQKAMRALVFFLIAMLIYITVRFEFRMAVATVVALVHDVLIVLGAYAVFQLPVTPATVVAILTILGFSIYDGVVVFDRVDENSRLVTGTARTTYSDMVNLSLNQVFMRSLNTQITSVIPIVSVLVVGSLALGAATLQEFGMALFIGQLSGAYSSLFIASPLLAILKEREPRYRALRQRLAEKGGRDPSPEPDPVGEGPTEGTGPVPRRGTPTRPTGGTVAPSALRTHPPRPRKQGKRR